MMKNIANTAFVVLLSGAMLMMAQVFNLALLENLIEGRSFSVYWGWFDWMTILHWIPHFLLGFMAGLCVTLLAFGTKPHFWALSAGFTMAVTAFLWVESYWAGEPPIAQYIFFRLWPLMYIAGAYFGCVTVVFVRRQLTRRSTGRAFRRAG
jgi:hypothetical protein